MYTCMWVYIHIHMYTHTCIFFVQHNVKVLVRFVIFTKEIWGINNNNDSTKT